VVNLAIPSARDKGRDHGGIIEGPSVGSSRAASMRSILGATHAGSFRTRLTDVEVLFIPANRYRTDVTPTRRECLQQAHPVVRGYLARHRHVALINPLMDSCSHQKHGSAAFSSPRKRGTCRWRPDPDTRVGGYMRADEVILPEGRHEPPPKMAQASEIRFTVQ
jgi:hypothetical protein